MMSSPWFVLLGYVAQGVVAHTVGVHDVESPGAPDVPRRL